MELKISKDDFSKENFDAVNYLNNLLLKGKPIINSDLLSFKLKIIQREINRVLIYIQIMWLNLELHYKVI